MSWELRNAPKAVKVTKKMAADWAEMSAAKEDRPLSERRLDVYRRAIKEGTFRPVTWSRAWCKELSQWFRVNGKHTSTLLSSIDLKSIDDVFVIVEEFDCDTLEDVAKLYATYDSKIQLRTASDINRSFAATIPELTDIPSRTIGLAVAGLAYAAIPTQPTVGTAAERAERLFDHTDFVLFLHELYSPSDEASAASKHLQRNPVAGAIATTYLKSKSAAGEFWRAVRDETGSKPNMPDRKVARMLITNSVDNGNGAHRAAGRKMDARAFYVKCLHGWNAWRRGEATDLKYYLDAKIPAAI
jgi:hypothetical protein